MTNPLTSEHGPSEIDDLLSRDFPEVASLPYVLRRLSLYLFFLTILIAQDLENVS